MTPTLTRRHLLQGSLAGLTAGMSGGCAQHLPSRRVVIVGAGLSGLNAALILERWGFEPQVVEAQERVGGRLWTLDHLPGSPEGGGNVMGSHYGRILKMAHDLGVPLRSPPAHCPPTTSLETNVSRAMTGRALQPTPFPTRGATLHQVD